MLRYEELRDAGNTPAPEELCRDYPELIDEVRKQIRGLANLESMLGTQAYQGEGDNKALVGVVSPDLKSAVGSHRFQVVNHHASGGLGEVFVARDERLGRNVALKRMKPSASRNSASRRRFLTEAEVTSRLEHPGVVPVYALTEGDDGEPCYAMRFIEGESLKDAIERFHADGGRCDSLPFRQLLNRFVAVCNTMAYVHSRNVLHRDLKPANIMLGKYGETLVVDWGLARDMSQNAELSEVPSSAPEDLADQTREGQIVGTPAFMSPEQATGRNAELTPASDIYSLGATLYCLLTGKPPLQGRDLLEILKALERGVFTRPRQVNRTVSPALEAVCLKAMALKPKDRYATALDLAADLDRFAGDLPVTAWREPLLVRARRWMRRHRALTMSASVLLFTTTIALGIGLVAVRLEQKKTQDALSRQTTAQNRTLAALSTLTQESVEHVLAKQRDLGESDRSYLRNLEKHWEEFAAEIGDSVQSREIGQLSNFRLGSIRFRLGDSDRAMKNHTRAIELGESLVREFPERRDYRDALATTYSDFGVLHHERTDMAGAEKYHRLAFAERERLNANPDVTDDEREDLATSCSNLGLLFAHTGRLREADEYGHRALDIRRAIWNVHRDDFRAGQGLAHSLINLAPLYKQFGKYEQAIRMYREAGEVQRELLARSPNNPQIRLELSRSHVGLANSLSETGKLSLAEKERRLAIGILEKLAAEYPARPDYRQELAVSLSDFGTLLGKFGRTAEAQETYRQALALQVKLVEQDAKRKDIHRDLATTQHQQAQQLFDAGRVSDAIPLYEKCVAAMEQLVKDNPREPDHRHDVAKALNNLGRAWLQMGRLDRGLEVAQKAKTIHEQLIVDFPDIAQHRRDLAAIQRAIGVFQSEGRKYEDAAASIRRSLEILEPLAAGRDVLPEYREDLAQSLRALALVLRSLNKQQESDETLARALAEWKRLAAEFPDNPEYLDGLASTQSEQIVAAWEQGKGVEALALSRDTIAIKEKLAKQFADRPDYRLNLGIALNMLGALLREAKKAEESLAAFSQSAQIQQALADQFPDRPGYQERAAQSTGNLGIILIESKQKIEAEKAFRKAVEYQNRVVQLTPSDLKALLDLAQMQSNLGAMLHQSKDLAKSEAVLRDALKSHRELTEKLPNNPMLQLALAGNEVNLGVVLLEDEKFAEAVPLLKGAAERMVEVRKKLPNHPNARGFYLNSQMAYATALSMAGQYDASIAAWNKVVEASPPPKQLSNRLQVARNHALAGRMKDALDIIKSSPANEDGEIAYLNACIFSLCSAIPKLPASEVEALRIKSLDYLRTAQKKDWFKSADKIEEAAKDKDLVPLYDRGDFKSWWREMTGKEFVKPAPKPKPGPPPR